MRGFRLVLKIFLLCATAFFQVPAAGQSLPDLALKNLQRQKWQRAFELLTKALAKDSLNVTAKYVLAQYFFSEENPDYHLDSAYHHVQAAIIDFESETLKHRERLRRFPVDSMILIDLRGKIDSVAFVQTKKVNTEGAWTYFIENFAASSALPQALELRDSVAYEDAVTAMTYQSFHNFMVKYPRAKEFSKARDAYEKLLFEAKTSSQTLKSYEDFLTEYPGSPYRALAERSVFEYRTASGEIKKLIDFVRSCPENRNVKKAKNILFHLIRDNEKALKWPQDFSNDSLRAVIQTMHQYRVPFLKNKKLGLMDAEGHEIIPAQADSLEQEYTCGNIDDDVILLPGKVISKNGSVIWNGHVSQIDEIGMGFLLIDEGVCRRVIHKTGFRIAEDCVTDAKIISEKFIATRNDNHWSLWTFAGRSLVGALDEIFSVGEVIVFKRNNSVRLISAKTLSILPQPPGLVNTPEYDEATPWNNALILVRRGMHTGLIDQSLSPLIALARQTFSPAFFGIMASDSAGTHLYNTRGIKSKSYRNIQVQSPWVAVKDSLWRLVDLKRMEAVGPVYDSIYFSGPFAVGNSKDSCHVYFKNKTIWRGRLPVSMAFIPGLDSTVFLLAQQQERKTIFDTQGQKLFASTFDKIQYAGANLFIVHKNDKKGLATAKGQLLLPVDYDAISTVNNGFISVLKSSRFGLFDYERRKQIAPVYAKNLAPYNRGLVTAYKDGWYGFVGWDNKPASQFEFNDIQFWNDTVALVKKDMQWMLYEIKTRKILLDQIKALHFIRDSPEDKLAIIFQGSNYGVIHNHKGTIIPISFSDIINVGSAEKPFYFTEKNVEEAAIFVVIYYNDRGELVRKEIYDQEDYDTIYCSHH